MRRSIGVLMGLLCSVAACESAAQRPSPVAGVEDIYVARSLRVSRVPPTGFCAEAKVGFANAISEDDHTFLAIAVDQTNGRLTQVAGKSIGRIHTCLGATADPLVVNFYGEGHLGAASFTGRGECRVHRPDFPEPGVSAGGCFLRLGNLPPGYVGGQLTTNTISSRTALGDASDPTGYVQPSIATVRLWRGRP
jgi:hypothetical protein